ncbi:uncharacterized protein LOC141668556 [Apium graveolens]|uniref:uncharacterized protein LOC141668556 n=1 Tax=Apium graveolens TaxID=4045 RepID=UPI003D7B9F53
MESGMKICLMVEHCGVETRNSIYMIEPPIDDDDYEIDSDGLMTDPVISPVITIDKKYELLNQCAMVKLGSRIYFFGGVNTTNIIHHHRDLLYSVRYLDINNLESGLCSAPSLNAPKQTPCVFSARGMIYALGSYTLKQLPTCKFSLPDGSVATGIFERYDPTADAWQVLPDPPLPFGEMRANDVTWCDSATIIADRYVFVGNPVPKVYVIFDLDAQKWGTPFPESFLSSHFPYGSLCVDNSLYYLTGFGTFKYGTQFEAKTNWLDEDEQEYDEDHRLQIIKRGPLSLQDPSSLLKSHCFRPQNKQLMARFDPISLLAHSNSYNWRELFHLGGHFFCYLVTSQLINSEQRTKSQPYCRGVWIDVLEEVNLPASNSTHFRTLASFSYRIRTPFLNKGNFIRCCVFGSVPDSWVKEPSKKKQVPKERKTFNAEQIQLDHASGSKGEGDCIREKIVAAESDEIIWLRAQLAKMKVEIAKKDELLKTYESIYSAT